jgi:hypothetical protein
MAKRRGGEATKRYIEQLPTLLVERVLPGAARAGAKVIANDAKARLGGRRADTGSGGKALIADSVKVRSRKREGLIVARVLLSGPGAYVGRWLEYGTKAHFITLDAKARQGMTARRVNTRIRDGDDALHGTLMINGERVGTTVYHPGARKVAFLRPALDNNEAEARAAAQAYITRRVTRSGIIGDDEGDEA